MLRSDQQQLSILSPQGIFSPAQWLSFDIYQRFLRFPRYSPNAFMLNHPSFYFYQVGWHSKYPTVFAHSIQYRLLRAVTSNNLDQILTILKKGFYINGMIQRKYKYNALQIASITNNYPLIELLIMRGADVNAKDPCGNTPLMLAVINNNHQAVHSLIKSGGGDPSIYNNYGFNAFDKAAHTPSILSFLKRHHLTTTKFPHFIIKLQLQQSISSAFWLQVKEMKIFTGRINENYLSRWNFDFSDNKEVQEVLR